MEGTVQGAPGAPGGRSERGSDAPRGDRERQAEPSRRERRSEEDIGATGRGAERLEGGLSVLRREAHELGALAAPM